MKKILLLFLLLSFSIMYSQIKSMDYDSKVKDLKSYVEDTSKNNLLKFKTYVQNKQNEKIYSLKSKDVYDEYGDMVYDNIFQFLEKDGNIVYIKRLPYYWAEGMPFNESFYEFYFDENKRLIGAKKSVNSTYEEYDIITYNIEYLLNIKTDKLEKVNEYYSDMLGNKLDTNSKKVRIADKNSLLKNSIKFLDSITFRDLEGFMKLSKIKYFK